MSKREPKATIKRAKVWAHRQSRDQVGYEVAGFPAKTHRSPEARYLNIPAFVLQKFVAGADFDINVTVTLAEARAIRDQWSAAIVEAERHEQCGADCRWCRAGAGDLAESAEPCNACAGRAASGLEGLCPACANERTRTQRASERSRTP